MAINDIRISEMAPIPTAALTEATILPIVSNDLNFKLSFVQLVDYVFSRIKFQTELPDVDINEFTEVPVNTVDGTFRVMFGAISDFVIARIPSVFLTMTFDYAKAQDILDIPATYTPIVSMVTPVRDAGTYMYGLSLTADFADTNDAFHIRFSTDGGANWTEFTITPNDVQDNIPVIYAYPKVRNAGILDMRVEARKDLAGNTFNIKFADIWYERKL